MKKWFRMIFFILVPVLIFLFLGCNNDNANNNISYNINGSLENESVTWIEINGRFYTKDLERARTEIPFNLILPTYIPQNISKVLPLNIDGPLQKRNTDDEITVNIKYPLYSDTNTPSIIIEVSNYPLYIGDTHANQSLKIIMIRDKQVTYSEGDFGPGHGFWFNFSDNNLYYIVEIYSLEIQESIKVIESMIVQMN